MNGETSGCEKFASATAIIAGTTNARATTTTSGRTNADCTARAVTWPVRAICSSASIAGVQYVPRSENSTTTVRTMIIASCAKDACSR